MHRLTVFRLGVTWVPRLGLGSGGSFSSLGSFKIDLRATKRRVGSTKPVVSCWRNAHFHKTARSADRLVAFSGGRLGFKNGDSAWDCHTFRRPPAPSQVDFTAQSRGQVQPSGQGDQTVSSTGRVVKNVSRFNETTVFVARTAGSDPLR